MALNWLGDKVSAKLRAAQVHGVNATMAAAVAHAKSNHAWQNRTGTLEGGIGVVDYAAASSQGVRGQWGVRDVVYARAHEEGAEIRPKTAQALHFEIGGQHVQVQQVTLPARPYLRPAADVEYPKLATRIRRAFERSGQ